MWEIIRCVIATILIIIGLFISICGLIGFYKFKFILNRMHSAALIDTLGLLFIILGLVFINGFNVTALKLLLVVVLLWLTSPLSSHLLAKLIYLTDDQTDNQTDEITINDLYAKEDKHND